MKNIFEKILFALIKIVFLDVLSDYFGLAHMFMLYTFNFFLIKNISEKKIPQMYRRLLFMY